MLHFQIDQPSANLLISLSNMLVALFGLLGVYLKSRRGKPRPEPNRYAFGFRTRRLRWWVEYAGLRTGWFLWRLEGTAEKRRTRQMYLSLRGVEI